MLGKAIESLREKRGLTQEQLGRGSELTLSHINRIEKGQVNPSYGNVGRIARALGVDRSRLAEEEARIEGRLGLHPRLGEAGGTDLGIQVGQAVRLLRENAGLSRRRLAKRCDMREDSVRQIERGRSLPKLDTVLKLIASLDTTPDGFFEAVPFWCPTEEGEGYFLLPELSLDPA